MLNRSMKKICFKKIELKILQKNITIFKIYQIRLIANIEECLLNSNRNFLKCNTPRKKKTGQNEF